MKQRLISALVALILSVPIIYYGGTIFYIFALILSLIGLREMLNLIIDDNFIKFINYFIYLIILGNNILNNNFNNIINSSILGIIFLIYCLTIILKYQKVDILKILSSLIITLILGVSFSSLIISRNISLIKFVYLLIVPLVTDAFAYIFGRLLGKHKMTLISPKKTWEGSLLGLIFGTIIGSLFYLYYIDNNMLLVIISTMLFSIVGQFGDLFFSLIKRNYNIKDFSNLMPGHGGVLDRLDSVLFVFLMFIYFANII